uniref:Protein G12 n=1 Tax=Bactrocera latifrons TaxID=174628 RepID=A0A0K8VYL2_BACLA
MFAQLSRSSSGTTTCILFHLLLTLFPQALHCRPSSGYTTDGTELIVVKEIVRCTRQGLHELCQNSTATTNDNGQQPTNVANESVLDTLDDLILLETKPKQTDYQQQQRKSNHPYETYQQQSELLSSAAAREDSIVSAAAAAPAIGDPSDSTALGSSYQQEPFSSDSDSEAADEVGHALDIKTTDVDAVNAAAADEIIADGVLLHGVLLRLADGPHTVPQPVPPIDMSDFISLIPTEEVKSIATNYYNNDAEVRRAYAYLSGPDFIALRQHIVASPEVGAFLQYLNVSGFDVLKFVSSIANLTKVAVNARSVEDSDALGFGNSELEQQRQLTAKHNSAAVLAVNEISRMEQHASATATSPAIVFEEALSVTSTKAPTAVSNFDEAITQKAEQLNGLHGLVDSILEILPQDQILATFFDKLESDDKFRKFVNNIQRPAFAQILSRMEQSMSLRNLIFTLHNNDIYITRIVDSLKAYFFLGGFS